ncbi:MAG: DMT family transporter [Comamonas sp.]
MPKRSLSLILLQAVFVVSWSSGFIGAKLGTADAGAITLLFWRFLLVTACLLPLVWHRLKILSWAQVRYNGIIGLLSQFAYLVCVYVAIRNGLPTGIAAIICALQPLITAALSTRGPERSGGQEWAGLVLGFLGVGIVIAGEYAFSRAGVGLGLYLLPLISATTLAVATLYQRRQSVQATGHSQDGLLAPLFLQSATSLLLLLGVGVSSGSLEVPGQREVWLAIAWLTLFSTFMAYLSLWSLLTRMSATRVATLVYFEPPVTLVWAAWLFGDAIHWTTYVGIAIVACGVLVARRSKPLKAACA